MILLKNFRRPLCAMAQGTLLLFGSACSLLAQSATVNQLEVVNPDSNFTNDPMFLVEAHENDGSALTANHEFIVETDVTYSAAGYFRLMISLLDESDTQVVSKLVSHGTVSINDNRQDSTHLQLGAGNRLDPNQTYRVQVAVQERIIVLPAVWLDRHIETEATGRHYYHFTNLDPNDIKYNIIAHADAVDYGLQTHIIDTVTGQDSFPVVVDYSLFRWDEYDSLIGVPDTKNVSVTLEYRLFRSDGMAIPLDGGATPDPMTESVTFPVNNVPAWESPFAYRRPSTTSGIHILHVNPAEILASNSHDYYVTVEISHTEFGLVTTAGNELRTADQRIAHFSGALDFDGIPTTITASGLAPVAIAANSSFFDFNSVSGHIDGFPTHTFDNEIIRADLDETDGSLDYNTFQGPVTVNGPAEDVADAGGVSFTRSGLQLKLGGLFGEVTAQMPPGSGYTKDLKKPILSQALSDTNIQLNSNLVPAGDIDFADGPYFVNEESKPVWLRAPTIRWSPAGGEFKFPGATVRSIRRPLMDALDDAESNGLLALATMKQKRSNDHTYNHLNPVLPEPSITTNANNKSAELNATISLNAGNVASHHPYQGIVAWGNPGTIAIVADKIDTAASFVDNANLEVPYYQHCPDCENAQISSDTVVLTPDNGRLFFTENGGFHAEGNIITNGDIGWGQINNANPVRNAHQATAAFQRGNFFMTGHAWETPLWFVPQAVQPGYAARFPRSFLAAGISPADLTTLHFPGSANFNAGTGDYAGINFRVTAPDSGIQMTSMLGGNVTAPYGLKPNSKFYVRLSGVSGVQDAPTNFDPPASDLYGYPVDFSSFGLSWLSNVNIHSRTNGTLSIPYPSNFSQDFKEMKFSCLGAPTVTPPSGVVDKELEYWDAPFTILSMQFLTDNGCAPDAGNTCLAVGASMNARFVDVALFGTLGFNQNGQIITPGDNRCGITSRFPLPPSIEITGPQKPGASDENDVYVMNPVQEAYLNSESSDDRAGPERVGYWNLAGTVDVPFFEDLQVQVQTEATAESPVIAPMYVQGGWEENGETAFSLEVFDDSHRGHNPGAGNADTYRNDIAYGPHAKRRWYGLLDFDYPLEWSPIGRRFGSPNQPDINLIVASVEHRLNFLTPRHADLSFGVEYDGIPRINLSNYVLDAVDSGSGIAQSLIDAAGEEVFGTLEGGLDSLAGALASQADEFIGGAVDVAMDSALDDFTDALVTAVSTGNATITEVIDTHIRPQAAMQRGVNPPISPLGDVVAEIIGDGQNLVGIELEIDGVLVDAQRAIDSLVGEVTIDPISGDVIPAVPGIFKSEFGNRQGAINLVNSLVTNLAPDFTNVLNSGATSEIINEAEAAFSQIETALLDIRQTITETRARLGAIELPEIPDTDFLDQLRDLRSLLEIELRDDILDIVADRMDAYLNELLDEVVNTLPDPADIEAYMDDLKEEIKQRIRDEIRDQLMSGEVIAEIQEAIRDRLRLVHLAMREAIDEAFGEINKVIRELISETLAEVDNSLNDAVSEINEIVKTGRIQGHALINQDGLDELSLSALVQMGIPKEDPFEFDGFMRIKRIQTAGPAGCTAPPGARVSEITLGARGVPIRWFDSGADATITATFGVQTEPTTRPIGLGGSIELEGELEFEGFQVSELAGALKIGSLPNAQDELELNEYYTAFAGRARMSGTELAAGFYAGRTCSIEPLVMVDPEAASLIGNPPFTGVYLYGEGRIPIVDYGCAFRVSAGVGLGAFYFSEGPTYGGRMVLSASGEALCTVSVRGEISLTGLKQGNDYRFSGRGRISGKAGPCPFCVRFRKTVRATYDGGWDVDY